jgi:prepilin-type N-terminal cleavage/methylation domain-containing protein
MISLDIRLGYEGRMRGTLKGPKGYTFIELAVVILLLGIMITLITPRMRDTLLTNDLKATTRKIVGVIKGLRIEAVRAQETFYLHFDLGANRCWSDSSSMTGRERALEREKAFFLPENIRVLDIWILGKEKQQAGVAALRFGKKGYVQKTAIHLGSRDGRVFTLLLSPFLSRIEVLDRYVELEDT